MYKIVNEFPNELIYSTKEGPYISIYQPTHRYSPDNQQDVPRFKNLLKNIEDSLKQKYSKREVDSIMKPLFVLTEDKEFWIHTYDGIAVLSIDGQTIIYNLKRPVKELAVVSDSFHTKPLIRIFQSADRYHLLGLSRKEFALFEGNRYGLDPVDLGPDTPTTLEEALGDQVTKPNLSTGVHSRRGGTATFHGHGSKREEIEKDTNSFFRFVDRLVLEEYSKPSKLPLILVALDEYHTTFKDISHNPYLLNKGIKINYEALDIESLKTTAWEKLEPLYIERTVELVEKFENDRAQDLGSDDLIQVIKAATENRIDTILIESDRVIPGKINNETGKMVEGHLEDPNVGDVLDEIAEMVIKSNGRVIMLPEERMPSITGVAASYRF